MLIAGAIPDSTPHHDGWCISFNVSNQMLNVVGRCLEQKWSIGGQDDVDIEELAVATPGLVLKAWCWCSPRSESLMRYSE
jgi:hypothetical protein